MRYFRPLASAALLALVALPASAQTELPLGSEMPMIDHVMVDFDGQQARLTDAKGANGTVVVFWSNECTWANKYEERLVALANDYLAQGVGFLLVNASDATAFPKEGAEESRRRARSAGYPMRYVADADGRFATAYGAQRTPHVYVFDADDALVYVGTIDDSPGDPNNVSKEYLKEALDSVVAGSPAAVTKTKAFGCKIRS